MHKEDKAAASADNSREFGVLGDILKELQREEMEEIETEKSEACFEEIQETGLAQNTLKIMKEINETLKEIAETQKKILKEIEKKRNE